MNLYPLDELKIFYNDEEGKLFYFKINNTHFYPLIINENNIVNGKEYNNLQEIYFEYKNKLIMNIDNYDSSTIIELYEHRLPEDVKLDFDLQLEISNHNFLQKRKNNMLLTDIEIDILNRNSIDYSCFGSLDSLLYEIDEILNEEENEELEELLIKLEERKYYEQVNK